MERLVATGDGRVEVSGRWYGVRGRRFVRPTLTLTFGDGDGDTEQRWLADLEHKPWAAEDGEPWQAAFPVDVSLDGASKIELSVAPDIEVAIRSGTVPKGVKESTTLAAAGARSPVAKQPSDSRRPSARAQDVERLTTRLAAADAALDRERQRRATVERTLEDQRAEQRKLSAELGRARAELDLAQTRQREAEATSAELDSVRREIRAVNTRYEELSREHDRGIEAHAQLEAELGEQTGALQSARDALEQERARGAQALDQERSRRAQALEDERARTAGAVSQERARGADALAHERARTAERVRGSRSAAASTSLMPVPDEPPDGDRDDDDTFDDRGTSDVDLVPHRSDRDDARARSVAAHRTDRPVNPSLSRPKWTWRILALLVIAGVIVALWLVLHSTILHH